MAWTPDVKPRHRVIVDNDFSGDPDDLFALAHQVLSPSADIRGVIGSHLAPGDFFDPSDRQADNAAEIAAGLLALLGRPDITVAKGSNTALGSLEAGELSDAAALIVHEAIHGDPTLPLLATFGGGLTELAAAWKHDPSIESRLTAIWIGGEEYPEGPDAPPFAEGPEYNINIDIPAAQVVFNESAIPIIQVPRDAYRQCIVSMAELAAAMETAGELGSYLGNALSRVIAANEQNGHRMGETHVMGDNPLVLLASLQTPWEPDFSSTGHRVRPTPFITDSGGYAEQAVRVPRPIRVCTRIDTRLMFQDMFSKLAGCRDGSGH
ncbi:nucleoside hydrolase [Pseudarthrobacter sp. WHRI 8279]|uniref:nucleoside hydrolase n=1 Tax=Pseudarthrobacter sp. WHRI 8279 TaxID=3162566 RepID=UPI0032EB5F27